jgi:hypothetical protein
MKLRSVRTLLAVSSISLLLGSAGSAQQSTARPSRGGADHKARQVRPIQLGVSGGNAQDVANGFCCSGTLGALVQDSGGNQYVLSNTHVFAGDQVLGGNNRQAVAGDPISQAGLIDTGCRFDANDTVANLTEWTRFGDGSNVDAAIARSRGSSFVDSNGAILEIGTISSTPIAAAVGQAVKKSGRTTGLTRSSIASLNATISVGYTDECAGNDVTVQYTGQILINNKGSRFLAGGDSGSLMVQDVATNPRAVGLLFAGSSSIAVANPIGPVLSRFNVSLVGGASSAATAAEEESGPGSRRALAAAIAVQERHGRELLNVPGAIGHAVGAGASPVIKILVQEITPRAQAAAPRQIEGFPVVLEEVGDVRGMPFCSKARK